MTTNREWLYSLDVADLADWFDAEHVEHQDGTLDGYTEPENEDSRDKLEADVRNFAEKSGWLYPMAGTRIVLEWLDRQAAITAEETSNAWEEYRDATQREITELTAERDEWKSRCEKGKAQFDAILAERERYRSKFGKCLDYADAIHALMDDEGMA